MAASVFHSGYFGTVGLGGTATSNEVTITQWRVSARADIVRFKNSNTGPIPVYDSTFQEFNVSMTIDVDFANGIFSTPYNVVVGGVITGGINLYQHQPSKSALGSITSPSSTTNPGWVFPSYLIEYVDNTLVVDGKTTYMVSGWGFGAFTTPN